MVNEPKTLTATMPADPQVTVEFRIGPANPTTYRRFLEILFSPETDAPDTSLHTEAA